MHLPWFVVNADSRVYRQHIRSKSNLQGLQNSAMPEVPSWTLSVRETLRVRARRRRAQICDRLPKQLSRRGFPQQRLPCAAATVLSLLHDPHATGPN
eukprot:5297725-Pleurochrysis_carterae.AAC.1